MEDERMTKQEFIESLAKKTKLSKKDARSVVDEALELIVATVKKNQKITLTGFGTFEARKQKATQRINPQTGRKMTVPAKKVPKFRPGKGFKQALHK
jgi:DNA-binding protein HU-beta